MEPAPPLMDHQKTAMDWINRVERGLLGDEPGLGKSRVAVEAFDGMDILVVAPAMVISGGTWETEVERWSNYPDRFTIAPYSQLNARNGRTSNFGTKKNPRYRLRPEFDRRFDAVIVDEAHYTKGRSTSWTWAVDELAGRSPYLLEMTGTPVPNWAHELFTILQAVYPDKAKPGAELGSYWRWVFRWFEVTPSFHNPQAKVIGGLSACDITCAARKPSDPCQHWVEFMDANLPGRFLRRKRVDVLDLPPVTWQTVKTPMTTTQAKAYRQMKKDYLATLDDQEVVAWTAGAKNVQLDKITVSHSLVFDTDQEGGKLAQLRDDLTDRQLPTVVFAHYRDTVEACARVSRETGHRTELIHGGVSDRERQRIIKNWHLGKVDVLVGSLETLAEGLTLVEADLAIFVEVSYKPSRNEQARYRIDRLGQTKPVTIREYVTPGTVDERRREILATKTDQQIRMMSARDFARLL